MTKKQTEFVDKDHKIAYEYYDLCEKYGSKKNKKIIKEKLQQLIEKDPDFFDTYMMLYNILQNEGDNKNAGNLLNIAYEKAIKKITDKEGKWPDVLEWGWLENRHIIRTILNKAIDLWIKKEKEQALDLFRKLLKTNPGDNVGARDFILAIKMNMSFEEFEKKFNKGGFYDSALMNWFEENYKKFPDEFEWWEKAVEKFM
ncbi:MAG: tetratricopeptide repeat protein [Nitrospirota bacterium]|nr:tetratricopeptide repeat protein [Nitrospirota bacterium]